MSLERFFGPGFHLASAASHAAMEGFPRTALAVHEGQPCHLHAHLHRLQEAAAALHHSGDWVESLGPEITAQISVWMSRSDAVPSAALRLALQPEFGFLRVRLESLPGISQPYLLAPMPHPLAHRQGDPLLRHKGLGGPWSTAALAEARTLGAADALLLWADGTLAETAIAAVGVERDGVLTVPPPEGRVASLAEQLDLPHWAAQRGLQVEVGPLALPQHGQIWCMNALRGIWKAQLA
ncbi:aminotransferase class IV [Geothrix sp. PMB-07]|uniref:aminotransferase class IV n=1 Tax=Geothrix sp. PMB-07 TaxID=3068640 RepID=UPI0027416DD2|nr:aminotransferase class IV [Geothrix sp. PMB-07]WLT33507.1 aminotransferase class IV [Geothrix sp. PMB-07]